MSDRKDIGTLRINFAANTADFIAGLDRGSTKLDRFARQATQVVSRVDRAMGEMGQRLSLRVTAPLAALAFAATKAADPTGKLGQEIERLGLQAQAALKPLGEGLIRTFDELQPVLQGGVGIIQNVSQAFADADPATQKWIIGIGAAAAATGPLLFGVGALASAAGLVTRALTIGILPITRLGAVYGMLAASAGTAWGVLTAGTATLGQMGLAAKATAVTFGSLSATILMATSALAGFQIGKYIGTEVKFFQGFMIDAFKTYNDILSLAKYSFFEVGNAIREVIDDVASYMIRRAGDAVRIVAGGLSVLPETLTRQFGLLKTDIADIMKIAEAMQKDMGVFDGERASFENWFRLLDELEFNKLARDLARVRMEAEFATKQGPSFSGFAKFMVEDLDYALKQIQPKVEAFGKLLGLDIEGPLSRLSALADRLFTTMPLPFVQTRKEVEAAAKATKNLENEFEKMSRRAEQIRMADPVLRIKAEMKEIGELAAGGFLTDEETIEQIRRLNEELRRLGKTTQETFGDKMVKAVQAFDDRASDTLADFVLDGKNTFEDFAKFVQRRLFTLTLTENVTKPLFSGISANSAHGGAFGPNGIIKRFAHGGLVDRPSFFSYGRGQIGQAGEGFKPEAIMPLTRVGSDLGVKAVGGNVSVQIIDQRSQGDRPEVRQTTGPDGHRQVQVIIRDTVKRLVQDGSLDGVLGSNYGLRRSAISR